MRKKIEDLLHEAMKNRDKIKTILYRSILSDLTNNEKGENLDPTTIIYKAVKKREDAEALYLAANRMDLARLEYIEGALLSALLPPKVSDEEVLNFINSVIESGVTKMGEVIASVKKEFPLVDIKDFAPKIKNLLSGSK